MLFDSLHAEQRPGSLSAVTGWNELRWRMRAEIRTFFDRQYTHWRDAEWNHLLTGTHIQRMNYQIFVPLCASNKMRISLVHMRLCACMFWDMDVCVCLPKKNGKEKHICVTAIPVWPNKRCCKTNKTDFGHKHTLKRFVMAWICVVIE